jgi:hypothetical protein
VRAIRGALHRLPLYWEAGLRRLPFFTQRTAVLLLGVLVAALAMVGGVVAPGPTPAARRRPPRPRRTSPATRPPPPRRPGPRPPAGRDPGPTTAPQGPLDPVDELLGPVVSTLLP